MKAVVPGSFDPFTLGHQDVVVRASRLFDQVVVAVGVNIGKQSLFDVDRRVAMVRDAVASLGNVSVAALDGLAVDFCREHGASVLVRGARSGADYEAEWAMAMMNASMEDVETIVLPAAAAVSFISSTLVREVARAGGDIARFVPANVVVSMQKEL
ncbi:MAG: pantetheine-phosphate adenylyltransferase [Propionibacteriaceae bacterium]|nr:pantetheine-phosphate adenylyltransferase [Propionibacteriaceae bacterium]